MKIGFVGCGNMAKAIIQGILEKGIVKAENITAADKLEEVVNAAKNKFGIQATTSNIEAVAGADVIVLAVKPQFLEDVITEIRDSVNNQLIISIAAGKTMAWLDEHFGKEVKLVRCMPNVAALVGEAMTSVSCNSLVTEEEKKTACELIGSFGRYEMITENLMDAVIAVSGSSPAYVFMFIEAMADAAVAEGMPRDKAYQFAAQSVLGSAKMVLETGKHPGELKDMVCSPAGTTIAAVKVLEEKGFRSAVMEAMGACAEKNRSL